MEGGHLQTGGGCVQIGEVDEILLMLSANATCTYSVTALAAMIQDSESGESEAIDFVLSSLGVPFGGRMLKRCVNSLQGKFETHPRACMHKSGHEEYRKCGQCQFYSATERKTHQCICMVLMPWLDPAFMKQVHMDKTNTSAVKSRVAYKKRKRTGTPTQSNAQIDIAV